MNLKRTFGAILTILGIVSLIWGAVVFINSRGGQYDIKSIVIFGVLGAIFFFTGISLVRGTRDEAK